jgi:hypothetical protein
MMELAAAPAAAPPGRFRAWTRRFIHRLVRSRWLSAMLVAAVPLITCGLLCWQRMPLPAVHDEFSYLLAADTFAHGRLTNPPHPLWEHFESFHIIQQPTYQSKYLPGQGLMLALGQILGNPIIGVWIGVSLGCVATWWMLRGFLPATWALAGGLIIGVLPLTLFWGTNYWGGGLPMAGGGLVLGAAGRCMRGLRQKGKAPALERRVPVSWGIALGAGWGTLVLSRPYEGFVLSLCALAVVGLAALRHHAFWLGLRRVILPATVMLSPAIAWLGYYNYRVTGGPWLLPYTVHERAYAVAPGLLWQKPRPDIQFRHEPMRRFHTTWSYRPYAERQTLSGFLHNARKRGRLLNRMVFGTDRHALLLPLLLVPPLLFRDYRLRFAVAVTLGFAAGQLLCTYFMESYAGPVLGLLLLVYLCTLRHVRVWRFRRRACGRWVVLGALGLFLYHASLWMIHWKSSPVRAWAVARQRVLDHLRQKPGRFLVIVRYGADSNPHDEWVYNGADIDASKVVWTREMDPESNARLIAYFPGREVRLLKADEWFDGRVRSGQLWDYPAATRVSP